MELNLITQAIGTSDTFFESNSEQPVDCDISLPDYCPDIQRVLKCTVTPRISSVQTVGERITADGTSIVRIIYVSEKGKLKCFEQAVPLTAFVEVSSLTDDCSVSVRAKTDYANCRALSPRRADVHGIITVNFKVKRCSEEVVITGAEGAGIQLKSENVSAVSVVAMTEKGFPMSEVVEIDHSKPDVTQIVRMNAVAVAEEIKAISNKLLIKGDLLVNLLYYSDSSDGELISFEHSMPISQIIELGGIDDDCISETRLIVSALDIQPKTDSSGQMKLLDISARVSACISAKRQTELTVIADAYSTKCDTRLSAKSSSFMNLSECFKDNYLCKNSLDFSGSGIATVLDIWCSDVTSSQSIKGDDLYINGTLTLNMIFTDTDGQLNFAERQSDFEYRRTLKNKITKLFCEPDIHINACNCSVTSDGKVETKTELMISACIYSVESKRIVSAIELDESSNKNSSSAELTVYFSDSGEQVWDIARKYNTTVEAVMQENSLDSDVISSASTLLIPKVI